MSQTVNQLRASEASAHFVYVLFIEGIKYAFTNDESGGVYGTGSGSWIQLSEQNLINNGYDGEVSGEREVKRGLVVPSSISKGAIDPKTLQFQTSTASFELVDLDDTLLSLFATEGKDSDLLAEYIQAGSTALGTSVDTNNTRDSVNPRGKHIGLERIGPSGERNFFSCFPGVSPGGPEHFWNRFSISDPSVEPVPISDDPIQFAGRRVALYRIYGQLDGDQSDASRWPEWRKQWDEGGLVWWGTLRDVGEYLGGDKWRLSCFGPDSLLKKQIGVRTNIRDWMPVPEINLTYNTTQNEREDEIAIWFEAAGTDGTRSRYAYNGTVFNSSVRLTETNVLDLRFEISGILEDTKDDTNTNVTGTDGGPLGSPTGGSTSFNNRDPDARFQSGKFGVMRKDNDTTEGWLEMHVVMHERVWRRIGFDPMRQSTLSASSVDILKELRQSGASSSFFYYDKDIDTTQFVIFPEDSGAVVVGSANPVPGPGYWHAVFTTIKPGSEAPASPYGGSNGGGGWRQYVPVHPTGTDVFDHRGGFTVELGGNGNAYCQGTTGLSWSGVSIGGGGGTNRAGLWVFKGTIVRGEDGEEEDLWLPCVCEWRNSSYATSTAKDDGSIDSTEVSGNQALYVVQILDPRVFGFDAMPLGGIDWASSEDNPIEVMPMSSIAYMWRQNSLERASDIFSSLLVSTGSSTGWDGIRTMVQTFSAGENDPDTATDEYTWGGDRLAGSYGLRIPKDLVGDLDELGAAWPGTIQDPINRGKMAWLGEIQAFDLLHNLLKPRRVGLTLQGRKYGLTTIAEFPQGDVDASIGESDLAGQVGDPTSVIPSQQLRVTGFIDIITLLHGFNPDGGSTTDERTDKALDAGARSRDGTHEIALTDWLLPSLRSFQALEYERITGVRPWHSQWRELWAIDAAEFYSKRHFAVMDLKVDLIKGQDLYVGAKLALTNPWLITPTGVRGLTNHLGVVLEVKERLKGRTTEVRMLGFADGSAGALPFFAPCAKMIGYDADNFVIYCKDDFRGIGDDGISDLTGFVKPSWSTDSGSMVIQLVDLTNNALGPTGTVSSVDTDNNTIQLSGALSSSPNVNRDWLIIPASYGTAGQGEWVKNLYGFMVTDSTKTDAGVKGKEFLP